MNFTISLSISAVSALKKQLKDLDAGDRDLRLRIQAYDTSVSHLATL